MAGNYYRGVIYCSNPLEGIFRFEDKFQIYPLISDVAPHHKVVKHFPVVLEYFVEEKLDTAIPKGFEEVAATVQKMTNSGNKVKEIISLLTGFTNYRFFQSNVIPDYFFEIDDSKSADEINQQSSKPGANIYMYPGMPQGPIDKLSDLQLGSVSTMKHADSFQHFDPDGTEKVRVSEYLSAALHNYYALAVDERRTVYAALSLICNGVDLRSTMKSLSFISIVSSIETMVALEYRDVPVEKCKTCSSDLYKVMAKFRDYLLRYVSNNEDTKKDIKNIYGIRSKIAHTGQLFLGDNSIEWSRDEVHDAQNLTHIQAMQVARVSIINWVLMRAKPPEAKQFVKLQGSPSE